MENIEILKHIEEFYFNAWNRLIIAAGGLLALIGLIFPSIIFYLQNRELKLHAQKIESDMSTQLQKVKHELKEEIKKEFKGEIDLLNEEFDRKAKTLKAHSLHIQGNDYLVSKDFVEATNNFLMAFRDYLYGKDHTNLTTIAEGLLNICFKNISKKDLDDIFHKLDTTRDSYFERLKELDKDNIAIKTIRDLKYFSSKLPE